MTVSRIIIQSRLSSTRLPAKALLPVGGMPSIVLCALRAANRGAEVLVATSSDATDDYLIEVLKKHDIRFVRGSLDDVLSRFELATRDLSPNAIVARLTADNLFPDGDLVLELVKKLESSDLEYIHTGAPEDGLPYGLGAEVFTVRALREANSKATTSYEREHVTPWIIKNISSKSFKPSDFSKEMRHHRCTMDTFTDFVNINKIFSNIADPVNVSWRHLCDLLYGYYETEQRIPFHYKNGLKHGKLTLGTAQLGMNYGIANRHGQPSINESISIVRESIKRGITYIDCARGYADAEQRVGVALKGYNQTEPIQVVTKLDPMVELSSDVSENELNALVDSSVFRSCRELNTYQLQTLLLHRWSHRTIKDGVIWKRLLGLQKSGVIKVLGASVQSPEEALAALNDPDVGHIQLPFNIIDWRWKSQGIDKLATQRKDVVIHARSALLQGVLSLGPDLWPVVGPDVATEFVSNIDALVKKCERENKIDLCMAYVNAQRWIDSVVVGVESLEQLDENVKYFRNMPLSDEQCILVEKTLYGAPVNLLDPSKWSVK